MVNSFIAAGNRGFTVWRDHGRDLEYGPADRVAFMKYVERNMPPTGITASIEGRITKQP